MLDENRKKREISMEGKIINRGMEYGTEAFSHLPEKVKNLPTCCWKREIRDGKRTKVPYDPKTGRRASTKTRAGFRSFSDAIGACGKGDFNGIGVLICDGIAAFDIDHCISEDGSLNDLAASVLGKFKGCIDSGECYVEVSPSGTGLRGFFPVDGSFDYDKEKYYIKHGNLEIYLPGVTNRFVTVTGNVFHCEGTAESDEGIASTKSGVNTGVCAADGVNETATDPVSALISVLDEHMTRKNAISSLPEDFEPCSFLSDKEVLVKANHSEKFRKCFEGKWEGLCDTHSEADMCVLSILAFYCGGDMDQMARIFADSALMRDKFANEYGLTDYARLSMKRAIEINGRFYDPHYYAKSAFSAYEEFENIDNTVGAEITEDSQGSLVKVTAEVAETASSTISANMETDSDGQAAAVGNDRKKKEEHGMDNKASTAKTINTDAGAKGTDSTVSAEKPINLADTEGITGRLKRLISASPKAEALYEDENILLAAYAYEEDPATYERLRSIVRSNGMSIRRYEKTIRDKALDVRQYNSVMKALSGFSGEVSSDGVELKPSFIVFSRRQNRDVVDCAKLAQHIKENLNYILVENSTSDSRSKYVYEDGVYKVCSEERFKGFVKDFIESYDPDLVRMRDINEVGGLLGCDLAMINYEALNKDEDIINFRNGILNLDTMELSEHDPSILSTIQLPCEWKGTPSPTPVFDSYLDTLTAGDPETQKLLLQFMGVALSNIKGSRYKKALFMVGEGDTGKSQLKILTEKLLGHDNYAGIDLQELEARFGSSAIYGKRLAGSADMSYVTVKELKTFKLCTGGDSIFIEFKGKNAFSFIYGGLIWFCMNRLPRFGGDDGKWVFDRIMVVRCENIIPLEKQDKKLVDKMYAERDGIIYKAVMAVRETIENGHRFSEPDKVIEARNEYRTENNSVLAFINECMEKREFPGVIPSNDKSNIKTVFLVYRRWCGDNNNGFAKTFKEFKECYAGFTGVEVKNISKRTGNGMSLLEYKLTDEAISDYTNDYDFYGNIRVLE